MKSKVMFLIIFTLAQERLPRDVTTTEIPGVISGGLKWQEVWRGTDNADGIAGTSDGGLLFAQEQPSTIRKLDKNDKDSVYVTDTHGAGAVALDSRGRIFAVQRTCTDPGKGNAPCSEPTAVAVIFPDKERKVLADNFQGKPLGRLNDLVVDQKGTVYFTVGGAYYAKTGGPVTSLGENIRSNGIMLSPDEKTLYVTNGGTILAFDVQRDGTVNNRRDFAKLQDGNGDGMAIDAAGRLYVTRSPAFRSSVPRESIWARSPRRGTPSASPFRALTKGRSTLWAAAHPVPTEKNLQPRPASAITRRRFTKFQCRRKASRAGPSSDRH